LLLGTLLQPAFRQERTHAAEAPVPYLVLTLEEMQAKGGFDRPATEMLTVALNSMEEGGYALVAVEPAGPDTAGSTYVFHRASVEDVTVTDGGH
jgi:hypothetical protein